MKGFYVLNFPNGEISNFRVFEKTEDAEAYAVEITKEWAKPYTEYSEGGPFEMTDGRLGYDLLGFFVDIGTGIDIQIHTAHKKGVK